MDQDAVRGITELHGLHAGESEVIVLAQHLAADSVVLDDQTAVEYAKTCDLDAVRTPALYVAAKRRGLIDAVQPNLDRLRSTGFRLKNKDYEAILRIAGER